MFSILLNGAAFAVSYVTKSTLIDVIAFYSRVIVMTVFGLLVGCLCWFFVDMSKTSVSVEINAFGNMIIVDHNEHRKVVRKTDTSFRDPSVFGDSELNYDEAMAEES